MIRCAWLAELLAALPMSIPQGPAAVHAARSVTAGTCDEAHLFPTQGPRT